MAWSMVNDQQAFDKAMSLIPKRFTYQRDLLFGNEAISGSTLRGKAKNYSARYHRSAYRMLGKLISNGIPVAIQRIGRRDILVIG